MNEPVVLFDGICNLCNATVTFLLERDRSRRLRFLSLQSPKAQEILQTAGQPIDLSTIVFLEDKTLYFKSTAILRIVRYLGGMWRWAGCLLWIPRPLRDAVYTLIVRNRYRWFGKRETCRLPEPGWKDRFL
jgi:predicted DCC family thiol-disulfide oxidoreductase YuxK